MSYTELEHGYQDLRSTSRPIFYIGDINTVQPSLVDPVASSLYRTSKRGELSDGCSNEDGCMGGSDLEGEGKQVLVGVCAMAKKSQSKPMKEILTRLEEFEYIKVVVFPEEVILKEPVEDWPIVDCLISFHSKGFPLDKAIHYANLRNPFNINNLPMQYDIQDRRRVYAILDSEGIEIPRYAVLDRDSADPKHHELVESEDHVEVNGVTFNKPFVEKPVSAEDHNIYIYYPTSAGGGSQRLFRKVRKRHSILPLTSSTGNNKPNGKSYATDKLLQLIPITGIGSRSSVYSPESRVRKTGSYIYEDFMPTDGTDVKVYTVGPDYAHAEARKSPALDGKVERDSEGKEIRYPVILSNAEKLISRKVCLAFKQTVCGFDLLRANGKSFVCDVNGFSFVKNSNKYYDDCAKILGNMILRELAPTLHIPWSVPFQLDDPPIVPTTFGKMMELRCVVAVIRHGDRTPKQKMKVEVRHPKFFEIFAKYDGYKHGHVKLKRPKQLQEILDTARSLLTEIQHRAAGPELEEKQGKLEQLKSVLEMYGHFSGINRKVQMKYQPRGRPRGSSSDDDRLGEPSLVLILKWGGELTPAGRIQAEELGRIFRCMYPGGQGRHLSEDDSEMLPSHGEYAGAQGLGLLRLHSTFRHDLKIYASDEGRVQMTAAAFAKGLLALEGELTPILVQMVKSANTNGLLDNDCDSSKYQNMVKTRLHELLQQDREFTKEDREQINPGNALSINDALDFVKNPVKCCQHVQALIQKLMNIVRIKKDDPKTKDAILYHGETWELMGRRWGKIEKDFCTKSKRFDISKIPDIYDCIKYDLQHNNHTLQFDHAEELYIYAKYLADIVIPQEYGLTVQEKLTIGQGICTPLLKKIRADLQRNIEESGEETVNRLNPRYSHGVSSPGRHVRTRLYFTSESHVHSLLTVLRYGGLLDVVTDEQWRRAMEYVSMVSELNYMSQIVVMLYEDPTKDPSSEERFHVELHFSPGVNCCVQKNLPPGPGFRPHSRNESSHNLETNSQCSTRIDEEDAELGGLEDGATSPQQKSNTSPVLAEAEETPDTTLDSPTTSRTIDMMDLDPNMMDEPYDSGFLQASAPIPISARTVAGHEAARLGSQLAASQRQRREREASGICEPRARSYDHQRQDKAEKPVEKLQYQSLDAVNKEEDKASSRFEADEFFYEEVESFVSPKMQSTGNVGKSNSPNFLTGPRNNSYFSSSPDLPSLLVDTRTVRELNEGGATPKRISLQRGTTCMRKNVQFDESANQAESMIDETDFWDFGETQILEESPICQGFGGPASVERKFISQTDGGRDRIYATRPDTENCSVNTLRIDRKIGPHEDPVVTLDTNVTIDEVKSQPREIAPDKNRSIIPSPKCLGIPVSLPHSVSSPDLPEPLKATILDSSRPLVTLHSNSLASSVVSPTLCGSHGSGRSDKTENVLLTSCTSSTLLPMSLQTSQNKRYGRSKSALTLSTGNDPRGESGPLKNTFPTSKNPYNRPNIDNSESLSCYQCGMARFPIYESHEGSKRSELTNPSNFHSASASGGKTKLVHDHSTSLPPRLRALNRRSSLNEVRSDSAGLSHSPFNLRRTSLNLAAKKHFASSDGDFLRRDLRFIERSRSLSPSPQQCLCYNCNVSILIQQSVNLPPDERSNFETYFVRSLSHKLINCCCYKMSVEAANASRRASRSASPNFTSRSAFTPSNLDDLPFDKSQPNSDHPNSSKFKRNRRFSHEPVRNRLFDRRRINEPVDERFDNNPHAFQIRRRSLPSFFAHKCNIQGANPRDLSVTTGQTNSLHHENLAPKIFHEISDHVLPVEKPSSPIPVGPKLSDICDDRNSESAEKSAWNFSEKSRNEIVSDAVLPNIKFDSEERPDPRTPPGRRATAKRSLPRQSSCPSGLIDPSMYAYTSDNNFQNCCNCYESTFDGNDDFDFFANQLNRSSIYRIDGSISSPRFLSPPLRVDQRPKSFLSRKFSCPIIIAESSDKPETSRTQAISVQPESPHTNRSAASSISNYREDFQSTDEQYVEHEQLSSDRRFGSFAHKKSLRRQVSSPETIGNFSDSYSCSFSRLCVYPSKLLKCEDPSCPSTANCIEKTFGTRFKYPITRCTCFCHDHDYDFDRNTDIVQSNHHIMTNERKMKYFKTLNTYHEYPKYTLSPNSSSSHPRLQTQRSFSSPDTRPSIIQQPDPTCTARRHRHSISGQMSYFKLLGYNVSKKLTGSTNSLFSTAVISGSSSAPNLKDMVPPHASAVAAIEGFGGVPPIRPLETLHNALSLRQLDSFLAMMTNAALFRTPASSPPKFSSPGGSIHGSSVIPNLSICNREYHPSDLEAVRYITPTPMLYKSGLDGEANDNRNQLSPTSPNSAGWSSEPQSFLSSGPSSPAPTSAGECSMSISLVSSDGTQPFASSKPSTTPRLDIEFNDFCRRIDQEMHAESRGSISYTDYYSNEDGLIRKTGPDLVNLRERVDHEEMSQDAVVDDDEDHTLTLRETEKHPKQDVKSLFDQNKEHSLVKPSNSYKKIGRFRVESMEITDEAVRIKEAAGSENAEVVLISSSNLSLDRVKTARLKNRQKVKTIARSQSVSTPQYASRKTDVDYSCQTAATNIGSFSTMSCEDLENWKRTAASPSASSVTSPADVQEEPILTLASSLKESSNIVVGFNVQDKNN